MKKKVLILLLIIIGLYCNSGYLYAEDSMMYGDVNKDGKINTTDASCLERYVLGITDTLIFPKYANVCDDVKVNSTDCSVLTRYILGIINYLPIARLSTEDSVNLSQLPKMPYDPTNAELKNCVSKTYDMFPQFKNLYETELKMSKDEVLAFHFAMMSMLSEEREKWTVRLKYDTSGFGPFHVKSTAFDRTGDNNIILNRIGMLVPSIEKREYVESSTYAGMREFAEGIIESKLTIGENKTTDEYLSGTICFNYFGGANPEEHKSMMIQYMYGVCRLMNIYLVGDHLTDNIAIDRTVMDPNIKELWSSSKKN